MEKIFMNTVEASKLLGLKLNTVYQYTSKGILPHYKKEGKIYFLKEDLIQWVKEGKVELLPVV
ncbi:MAG: helix-turn-helix domain-containing protein [Bacteroidetes bacterium]|nr:helix-turn-helix domain-containing protein [Bacteroidota bacterium]